jgi:ABC-type transport system involved in multi-copper enzyme maturation permease subunit
MKTILVIARDSIRALLHQRLLLAFMVASLALTTVFSVIFSKTKTMMTGEFMEQFTTNSVSGTNQLSETDRRKLREQMEMMSSGFQAAFYGIASFGGSLVSLFIFSTAVASEIRKGTIRLTLSKPVSRTQFLIGKYCGGVVVMACYALIASGAMLIFASSQGMDLSPAVKFAPWLMFCRQLMLGSVAMLLSLLVHPIIASVVAFFAGNGLCSPPNPLYYILPSYSDFNLIMQVATGSLTTGKDVLFLSLYAADIVIVMLLLAMWRFRTKELV